MKKYILSAIALLGIISISSCCNDHKCEVTGKDGQVKEGLVSRHTRKAHAVYQVLTPEEHEAAKEHVTFETAPGVSHIKIDKEGAAIVNKMREK